MIDREYIKLNTSIQTGSNAKTLEYNEEGNTKAVIEMQLPDSLFNSNTGPRKVEKVDLLVSKLRLSMSETPIAQIPIDTTITRKDYYVPSTCQLDVYPYSFSTGTTIRPSPIPPYRDDFAFPYYKDHVMSYTIRLYTNLDPIEYEDLQTFTVQANTFGDEISTTSRYYPILKGCGALDYIDHPLCLTANDTNESLHIEGNSLMVTNIATLQQMLQDALENALTYASTSDNHHYIVSLIEESLITPEISPQPDRNLSITFPDKDNITAYFWELIQDTETTTVTNHLEHAFKPTVTISEQSLTISYDTVPFSAVVPIIWNTSYVNTFLQPAMMIEDYLRNEVWDGQAPPKRVYKYGVFSNSEGYNFTLPENISCAVMNIIGNKILKETLSFLPWVKISLDDIPIFNNTKQYHYKREELQTISNGREYREFFGFFLLNSGRQRDYSGVSGFDYPAIIYTYKVLQSDEQSDRSKYYDQNTEWGTITTGASFTPSQWDYIKQRTLLPDPTTTTVLDEYDTNDSPSPVGTTIISDNTFTEQIDPQAEMIEQYNPALDVQRFYEIVNPDTQERGYVVGTLPQGLWLPNTDVPGYQFTPPRAFDYHAFEEHPEANPPYNAYTAAWFIPQNLSQPYAQYGISNARYKEQAGLRATQTIIQDVVIPNNGIAAPEAQYVLPNLKLSKDDKEFYILDGTTSKISIGPQEVIEPNRNYRYKITKTKRWETLETNKMSRRCYTGVDTPENITTTDELQNYEYRETRQLGDPFGEESNHCFILTYYTNLTPTSAGYDPLNGYYNVSFNWGHRVHPPPTITYIDPFIGTEQGEGWVPQTLPDPVIEVTYTNDEQTPGTTTETHDETTYIPLSAEWPEGRIDQIQSRVVLLQNTLSRVAATRSNDDLFDQTPHWAEPYDLDNPPWHIALRGVDAVTPDLSSNMPGAIITYNGKEYSAIEHLRGWNTYYTGQSDSPATLYDTLYYVVNIRREATHAVYVETTEVVDLWTQYDGNVRLSFTWDNLPTVIMSPISSIVLTLHGVQVSQEIHPINMTEVGGSTLTSVVAIVENYFSLAQTIRDLHDELVVVRDQFEDVATYRMATTAGQARVIRYEAKYITKDGRMFPIYIPKNGVFSLQLIFGVSYFTTS